MTEIEGYTIINDTIYKAADKKEVDDNTDISYLSAKPLKAGEEEYVHIYTGVDKDIDEKDLAMRFNIAGNCYYCYVD